MKTLIWTRALADWPADAELLRGAGNVLHLPCIKTEGVELKNVAPAYDALVFTSAKAAQLGLAQAELKAAAAKTKKIYTHGTATAAALAALGLHAEVVSVRTAEELATWLTTRLPASAKVGWPRADDPAFDLERALRANGFEVTSLVCYRTMTGLTDAKGKVLPAPAVAKLQAELEGVVCFASPSAVQAFAEALRPKESRLQGALTAVALGPTTAKAAVPHFKTVRTAKDNELDALATLARELLT